jgi:predicted ribosomally synthesized peptide with nif11-like leader
MSKQALSDFKTKLTQDENLREEIAKAYGGNEPTVEQIVAFARARGFDFSADELSELNEEELDAVAGGTTLMTMCCTGKHLPDGTITV